MLSVNRDKELKTAKKKHHSFIGIEERLVLSVADGHRVSTLQMRMVPLNMAAGLNQVHHIHHDNLCEVYLVE